MKWNGIVFWHFCLEARHSCHLTFSHSVPFYFGRAISSFVSLLFHHAASLHSGVEPLAAVAAARAARTHRRESDRVGRRRHQRARAQDHDGVPHDWYNNLSLDRVYGF